MNDQVTRRTMLAQMASLFVLGELKLSPDFESSEAAEDLHLAAAATFEFVLQKLARPTAPQRKLAKPTPELRREAYEISHLLKPWNAPQIFQRSQLVTVGEEILVVFSPDVSVRLKSITIQWLKHFARPWWQQDGDVSLQQVVDSLQILLVDLSQESRWRDD
jgi:hypothetical protein